MTDKIIREMQLETFLIPLLRDLKFGAFSRSYALCPKVRSGTRLLKSCRLITHRKKENLLKFSKRMFSHGKVDDFSFARIGEGNFSINFAWIAWELQGSSPYRTRGYGSIFGFLEV